MHIQIHAYIPAYVLRLHTDIHIHILEIVNSYVYYKLKSILTDFFRAYPHCIFTVASTVRTLVPTNINTLTLLIPTMSLK